LKDEVALTNRLSLPGPALIALAAVFAGITFFYAAVWMYYVRHQAPNNPVELGFNFKHQEQFDPATHSVAVGDVVPGSPAERAGLRPGDRIVAVNGRQLTTSAPYDQTWAHSRPGDSVELLVERPGEPGLLSLHGIFRAPVQSSAPESLARSSAQQIMGSFPVLFLVIGFAVLFLRPDNRYAWLLALMFTGFIAAASLGNSYAPAPVVLRRFVFAFRSIFYGLLPAVFYIFFALFPARSPLERRVPWLKWVGLALGVCTALPGIPTGDPRWPALVPQVLGTHRADVWLLFMRYVLYGLGMVSLGWNRLASSSPPEVRRKSRIILLGTLVGFLPIILERAAVDFFGFEPSFWLDAALVLILILYPLSFAYAVVKDRVLEIPVLLKRSARYVLVQRGFLVLLLAAAAIAITLFTRISSRFFSAGSNLGMASSAVFGILLVWVSAPMVRRGTERIDRAFFRSAYDARHILEDLVAKTRTVQTRETLVHLLADHIRQALQPATLVVYLAGPADHLVPVGGPASPELQPLPRDLPLLMHLARQGQPWEVLSGSDDTRALSLLAPLGPECLVPMSGRDGELLGLLALGSRLSEEPFSGEDKRLLAAVAGQAAVALENIGLAEKMAERMDAERRAAREMEIARQVQSKLLPQKAPPLATLDYAGMCIQARAVGGDYYDFLDLGDGRAGFVLADIAGKGMSAALLMANLQAHLRSQSALLVQDLPRSLQSVNRMFYESTEPSNYATLFLGTYQDATRRLRYANCGHNPPLLLRGQNLERLSATATVLGLFEKWECHVSEAQLLPGDVLVIYTDGIVEAMNADQEEFGEAALLRILRESRHLDARGLLAAIIAAVQQFSGGEQSDDLTLLIAQVR
jgi:sigma-B regulation protein RsbU (phosphoserine phosphatase)